MDRKTTQKTGIKLTKIQDDILQYLQKNPQASRKELTENIKSATEHGIKYNLELVRTWIDRTHRCRQRWILGS